MTRRLAAILLLSLAAAAASAAPNVELRPGQPLAVTLPADGFSNAVFIDVPAGAERLTVRLDAANLAQDVDLLLRYDAPFPNSSYDGRAPLADWLIEHAHFRSVSSRGDESVVITPASKQPLRGGRLYLSLVNFSSIAAPATLSASFGASTDFIPFDLQFDNTASDCNVAGWNDNTPRASVRGNSGTTLGQQRRNAMQEAARLMAQELRPNAPIRLQLCWSDSQNFETTETGCSGTLAQAGPRFILLDNPGIGVNVPMLDSRYVVQASAVAAHQSGTARCRVAGGDCRNYAPDVRATFNTKFDNAAITACHLDYGFTSGSPGSTGPSFISTAMHEIAHGMGFIGLMELSGNDLGKQPVFFGERFDDAYGRHAIDIDSNFKVRPLLRTPVEERLSILTGFSRLRFAGDVTRASPRNVYTAFAAPENAARLHSPGTLSTGSTYSHLAVPGHSGNLMTASISSTAPRTLGLGIDVLADVGWSRSPRQRPTHAHAPGQYYDVARDGHGFDLRPIAGFDNLYFVVFYSFDADGRPEYFTATGPIVDGVFQPAAGSTGDSLLRNLYLGPNQTIADPDPGFHGDVRIDFVEATRHPACVDGASGRQLDGTVAIMSWDINGTRRQWCTQPLLPGRAGVAVDFGNTWFQPADGGWGLSVLSFPGAGGDGVAMQIYFPDAQGRSRWGLMVAPDYQPGKSYPVQIIGNGYCRTCAGPPSAHALVDIGTMAITLAAPGEGTSTVSFDLTWPGVEGGRFTRSNVPIVPVGTPGYRQ
jgi:hypothetical protein